MLIQTEEQWVSFLTAIRKGPPIWIYDLETEGLDPYVAGHRLIGVAVMTLSRDLQQYETWYAPFRHKHDTDCYESGGSSNLPIQWLYQLAPYLADPNRTIIGFRTKFDVHFTEAEGMVVLNTQIDTMLAGHLEDENNKSNSLDAMCARYLDNRANKLEDGMLEWARDNLGFKTMKQVKSNMALLPPHIVGPYAEGDVILTWDVYQQVIRKLKKQGMFDLALEIFEYGEAVQRMEKAGILVDERIVREKLQFAEARREEAEQRLFAAAGREFNPRSPKQLLEVMGLPEGTSTDKEHLPDIDHPVADEVLNYRQWNVSIVNYFEKYLRMMDSQSRIHCQLELTGTVSSRLSAREPPFQALPRETKVYEVRHVIVAPRDYYLASLDYSQIELRLLAFYSQDPNLLSAYRGGLDIHTQTANATGLDRNKAPGAKTLNFATVYGIGVEGVMRKFRVSEDRAKEVLNAFHNQFPNVRPLYYKSQNFARDNGYIPLWTGRRKHYRPFDEHQKAMSHLIQGGVAEIMRHAITRLYRTFIGTRCRMVLQVHDDILFEIPRCEIEDWLPVIKSTMEDFDFSIDGDPDTRVPIVADAKYGPTWGDMQPWHPL